MIRERHSLHCSAYGGIITGLTIGIPFLSLLNCFCCGGVLVGGFLSVFFATRDAGDNIIPITSTDAMQLGALSGVIGAIIGTLLGVLIQTLVGDIARSAFVSLIEGGQTNGLFSPGSTDSILEMLSMEEHLSFFGILLQLITWLFIAPLFGLLGGMIGFSVFGRRTPGGPAAINPQPPVS